MSVFAVILVDPGRHGNYPTPQVVRVQDWHSRHLRELAFDNLAIFNLCADAYALKAEYEAKFPDAIYAVVSGARVLEEKVTYAVKPSFNPNGITEVISGDEVDSLEYWMGRK